MSLYLGENLISGNKPINLGVRNIGEVFPALLPVTDAGANLLDGSLILGGGIYQGFVDYIANIVSIYPDVFTTESAWQSSVTTYGVCGKFVYDSTNNTVRLPKVTGKIDGTTDINALGDLEPLFVKLPNITGWHQEINHYTYWDNSGAFTGTRLSTFDGTERGSDYGGRGLCTISLDASRSSSVYSGNGSDTAIHEQAIKCFVYIVIATSSKTDIQVDIDEIATDLNGKADTDLSNINASQSAKNEIISWGMPDYDNGIDISTFTSSSNQFTAPCDGIINWGHRVADGHRAYLNSLPLTAYGSTANIAYYTNLFVPISKNETWYATGYADSSLALNNKFFPLKGAN